MDATLTVLFSDQATEKNQEAYIPNDTAFHEDYKALLVHRISVSLTVFLFLRTKHAVKRRCLASRQDNTLDN